MLALKVGKYKVEVDVDENVIVTEIAAKNSLRVDIGYGFRGLLTPD
jgi:hypothetical protein